MRELVEDTKGLKKCGLVANISATYNPTVTRAVHVAERGVACMDSSQN